MRTKLILIILSFLSFSINGQNIMPELLSSSGGLQSGANTSLSWTLGEISIKTITAGDFILTQGFQQPRLYINSIYNPELMINATVYPNPAKDFINIDIKYPANISYSLSIIDINGRIYKSIQLQKNKEIDISGLKQGYYFIVINSRNGIELTGIKFLKLK